MPRIPVTLESHWKEFFNALPESEFHHGHSYFPRLAEDCGTPFPVSPLHQLGLLSLHGSDTRQFLQGQLTADVEALHAGQSCLAAHCDAKGRMQSNFYLYCHTEQHYLLQMPQQTVPIAQAALEKYAAFSSVELTDYSSQYAAFALPMPCPINLTSSEIHFTIPTAAGYVEWVKGDVLAQLPRQLPPHWPEEITWQGSAVWQQQLLNAGIGFVAVKTVGEWIPQMLNLDRLDGISFNKGCYTGQEIIARMKYRGQVKRRSYRFFARLNNNIDNASITAGDTLSQVSNDGTTKTPIGTVVDAIPENSDKHAWQGLAVIKTQSASASLRLQTDTGIEVEIIASELDNNEDAP